MRLLELSGIIKEMDCDTNLSYIVEKEIDFQLTEYKILRHQEKSVFIDCYKMLFNGKIQLYYFTNTYIPLESILKQANEETLIKILTNLYSSLLEVKNLGFLKLRSIVSETSHIYVDNNTKKVKLIYLPINQRLFPNNLSFESNMKKNLIQVLLTVNIHNSYVIQWIIDQLSDEKLEMEQIYSILKNSRAITNQTNNIRKNIAAFNLKIKSMDTMNPIVFAVSQDEFLIGRKASAVDGVVAFNKLIGRVHCKINRQGYNFLVTDLKSINGTYINGKRLKSDIPYPISDGDILKLATSEFMVSIE